MRIGEYDIPTDEMQLSCDLGINESSMGGNSSSTSSSHKGFEAKVLNVSLIISFDERLVVADIVGLAQSLEDDGSQTVYTIINDTAEVMGIQKVRFSNKFSLRELGNHKQGWRLSFTLREHESVAERKAEKLTTDAPTTSAPSPGAAASPTESEETKEQLTSIEKVMQKVDGVIAEWNS